VVGEARQYDEELHGVLFLEENKVERGPDFKGNVTVNGVKYKAAAWKRTSKGGARFLSLTLQLPDREQGQARGPEREPRRATPDPRERWD